MADKLVDQKPVRVRFAPSPTGDPHFGSARTALFNYLFAKHHNGTFIFRLEDTDKAREVEGSDYKLYEVLDWLGMKPDESARDGGNFGPYKQSERLAIYKKYAAELIEKGHAYNCFCTADRLTALREDQVKKKQAPRYDRHCRNLSTDEVTKRLQAVEAHVVRLAMPQGKTLTWHDLIKGDVSFQSDDIDDQVLLKSDGYPTYHLANVIDDHLMEISHVIRAEEWLSSTPKHLVLYEAFGWTAPHFAHVPLILGVDRAKMSKRHGHTSAIYYKNDRGYLPQAINHFMVFMGWTPETVQESYDLTDLVRDFSLDRVGSSPAIFDQAKLDSLGAHYMRQADFTAVQAHFQDWLKIQDSAAAQRFRGLEKADAQYARAMFDVARMRGAYFAQVMENIAQYLTADRPSPADLTLDGAITVIQARQALQIVVEALTKLGSDLPAGASARIQYLQDHFRGVQPAELSGQAYLHPTRVALTGRRQSMNMFEFLAALLLKKDGKAEAISRLNAATQLLLK